ncbi:MAG: 30S ribosomal protein S17 [Chloroflexota bacterium]
MTDVRRKPIQKSKLGRIISDRMQKTVVVQVEMIKKHPLYGRVVRERRNFKAHDENGIAHVGDWVRIVETRPLSRDKRWRVAEIVRRAVQL